MDSTIRRNELVAVLCNILAILQRKFPLPPGLKSDSISEQLFLTHGSSSFLLNGIIYYLICIADPMIRIVQWPIGTQNQAMFNQSIIKALIQLCKDVEGFQFSFRTSVGSILRDRKGPKFNKFMFELASNALRIANTNQGSRSVPLISSDVLADDCLETMRRTTIKLNSRLVQKRNANGQKQDEDLLDKLIQKKIGLKQRCEQLIEMCPLKFKDKMAAIGAIEQKLLVIDEWQADLNRISSEQAQKNNLLRSYNNNVDAIHTVILEKVAGEDLVNDENGPLLVKTANGNNIDLPLGDSVSLSGFMESSCITTEKLKTLVINKKIQYLADDLSSPLEQSAVVLSQIKLVVSECEQRLASLKAVCNDRQKAYDERVVADGGHEFPLPGLGLGIRVDTPPAPYSPTHLIQSPGTDSPKRVLEEAKHRRRDAAVSEANGVTVHTPKSSISRILANSSMSHLTKSVLQRQTLYSSFASHANSTVGDMIPLSSSSPVNGPPSSRVDVQNPPVGSVGESRPHRSSLDNVLNELDESNLSFWDVSEESSAANTTFDSPLPPVIQPRHTTADVPLVVLTTNKARPSALPRRFSPCAQNGQAKNQPAIPSAAAACATPAPTARHPRRSIQNLIERLQKVKASSTNIEVRRHH